MFVFWESWMERICALGAVVMCLMFHVGIMQKKKKTNPKLKIIILVKFDLVPTENRLDACGACCGFYLVFFFNA